MSSSTAGRNLVPGPLARARLAALAAALAACVAGCGPGPSATAAILRSPDPTWPPSESWAIPLTPSAGATSVLPSPLPQPPPLPGHHPSGSLLPSLAHGSDISFPQCGGGTGGGGTFTIVGVNGGRDFSLNPCFLDQWRANPNPGFVYVNSGYGPDNAARVTRACARAARAETLATPAQRRAYAIGCSTADDTAGVLARFKVQPAMWWLDVESANSWDDHDLSLNRASLRGEIDRLAASGRPVGVYATFRDWQAITGGWSYARIAADWVAGRTPQAACAAPGFSGTPVWIAQELATWSGSGRDSDYAC